MISCERFRIISDLRRTACGGLAALVIAGRVLMPLMCWTGAMLLVSGARSRRATGHGGGTKANAIEQKSKYSND
jgi:hypothetical protein